VSQIFTGQKPFRSPNQECQSTTANYYTVVWSSVINTFHMLIKPQCQTNISAVVASTSIRRIFGLHLGLTSSTVKITPSFCQVIINNNDDNSNYLTVHASHQPSPDVYREYQSCRTLRCWSNIFECDAVFAQPLALHLCHCHLAQSKSALLVCHRCPYQTMASLQQQQYHSTI